MSLPLLPVLLAAVTFQPTVAQQRLAKGTGLPTLEQGVLSEPLRGELSSAAKAWALARAPQLGLPAIAGLRFTDGFSTRFGASFHFAQQVRGVDVYGAVLVVTVDARARVEQVASSLVPFTRVLDTWAVGKAEAQRKAAGAVPLPALQADGSPYGGAKKVLFPVRGELHAGWLIFIPTLDARQNPYVLLDALTGEVLAVQNRVHHQAANPLAAQVYTPSPGGLDAGVGATPTVPVSLVHPDGGAMVVANDGGFLEGDQLTAYNCCVNAGCATGPDAGPARYTGMTSFQGIPVTFSVAQCERQQRATNDPTAHTSGDFVYAPVDPPGRINGQPAPVSQDEPADVDAFSEVHAFFHVNRVYDWVRGLSSAATPLFPGNQPALVPFTMRDERRTPGRKPAVWANVVFPDFNALGSQIPACLLLPPCRIDTLGRIDNAAFLPKENFGQIPLPSYQLDVDTLMIFQGNSSDFGYDAAVLWHEFGHGVVYATAALSFDQLAIDERAANNEGGALHEAFADVLSAAFGKNPLVGEYVGPRLGGGGGGAGVGVRQDTYLRTLENSLTCPDVLWGQVHQDSQHVSAAIWQVRKQLLGSDNGNTFDAAFYAALVSMAPNTDFATAAEVITAKVKTAFPGNANAEALAAGLFRAKGVKGCTKLLDLSDSVAPRPFYGISPRPMAYSSMSVIPGPYQVKVSTPLGAKSVRIQGAVQGGGLGGQFGPPPDVRLLVRGGAPITFTSSGNTLTNDAQAVAAATVGASTLTATAALEVPCGADSAVYLTLGSASTNGATVQGLRVFVTEADSCATTDAGSGGGGGGGGGGEGGGQAGGSGTDAGRDTDFTPAIGRPSGPAANTGCGCSMGSPGLAALLGLLALARHRRSVRR